MMAERDKREALRTEEFTNKVQRECTPPGQTVARQKANARCRLDRAKIRSRSYGKICVAAPTPLASSLRADPVPDYCR